MGKNLVAINDADNSQGLYYSSSELVRAIDRECMLTGLVLAQTAALPSALVTRTRMEKKLIAMIMMTAMKTTS